MDLSKKFDHPDDDVDDDEDMFMFVASISTNWQGNWLVWVMADLVSSYAHKQETTRDHAQARLSRLY